VYCNFYLLFTQQRETECLETFLVLNLLLISLVTQFKFGGAVPGTCNLLHFQDIHQALSIKLGDFLDDRNDY